MQKNFIQDIFDGNFTSQNLDAAISIIREFSRRKSSQVCLPLETRLELVEMLHPASREQQQEVIRAFQQRGQRREVLKVDNSGL